MLTNFQVSYKTKRPACCDYDCCGNHWGRIGYRSKAYKSFRVRGTNRIKKTRRYAKHVENRITRKEINEEIYDA